MRNAPPFCVRSGKKARRKVHAGRLPAARRDAPPQTIGFQPPAASRVPPYRPEAARPTGPHGAEPPYRRPCVPLRHVPHEMRPAASCGVLLGFPPSRLLLPPYSPNRPYSASHGVLRRHFRHAPAYPSYCLSPSADSPVYPYDTAASRALRRQAAVSVSRPISSYQFLTGNRTAAGTPACPARTGPHCRRTRGAPPYP